MTLSKFPNQSPSTSYAEAYDHSRSPMIARSLETVSIYSLTIVDDRLIAEKSFHIIAGSVFSDLTIVSDHMETRLKCTVELFQLMFRAKVKF